MIDALPDDWWPVAVAVTVALLDDPEAAECAIAASCPWSATVGATAARDALRDPALADAAPWCFDAAQRALVRLDADARDARGDGRVRGSIRQPGALPADDLLDDWAGRPTAAV